MRDGWHSWAGRDDRGLPRRRRAAGLVLGALLLLVATFVLANLRSHLTLATDLAIYLLIVVVIGVAGGFWAAVPTAIAGAVLLNFYFTPPLHTLTIDAHQNVVALIVFLVVAVVVSRVVDVSARRRAQATVASEQAETLAAHAAVRTALLNAVSHDLRTPIASAKAAVSGLLGSDVHWSDADRIELLKGADEALDRLTDLVTNLLDLSRLQAGVLPVLIEPVPLDGVVQHALDQAANEGALVETDVPADLPEVDAGLLERVVANLVQNALRFSPSGICIGITAASDGEWVEMRVIDRGPGIPRADAESVFVAFQRRDDAHNGEGVGLGLAIVRGFTEAMGGEVRADETPGGGATMVVRLRVAQ
jgi:two-component system sensor histidine kinase KdpD